LSAAGQVWVSGVNLKWERVRQPGRRISLPTYPFQRKRFWVESKAELKAVPPRGEIDDWLYIPSWQRTVHLGTLQRVNTKWLIFDEGRSLGDALKERLEEAGDEVTMVKAGKEFCRLNRNEFRVTPGRRSDFEALNASWKPDGRRREIVHLWSIGNDPDEWEEVQEKGFDSVLEIARVWGDSEGVKLTVVTTQAQEVNGLEVLLPEKATVLGCRLVIPQEYPRLNCRSVDLEHGSAIAVRELEEELLGGKENIVARRGSFRWVPHYERINRKEPVSASLLKFRGVYLITGGSGRIGRAIAQYLASGFGARIALMSRHERDVESLIKQIQELGGDGIWVQADVSQERQVRIAVEKVKERFGAINGVMHAAGTTRKHHPIAEMSSEQKNEHFIPKILGIQILERVLKEEQVDFWLLFSSLSAVLGGLGFSAHAGANAYLDTFARAKRRELRAPWISINWDGWQEDGSGITFKEGIKVLDRLLRQPRECQWIVATGNLEERLKQWVSGISESRLLGAQHRQRESWGDHSKVSELNQTQQIVVDIWKDLLGVDRIDLNDNFFELGGDSLVAIQIISRLRSVFRIQISQRSIFDSPTVEGLAVAIEENLYREIVEMSESEVSRLLESQQ